MAHSKMATDNIKRDEIRHEMIRQGIRSFSELAELSGLSRGTITNFFGGMTPTYNTMRALARALKMNDKQAGFIFFNK